MSIDVPGTPAGNQLVWYLNAMASDMRALTVAEVSGHMVSPQGSTDEELLAGWTGWAGRLGRCVLSGVERSGDFEIVALVETDKRTRYRLTLAVETGAPNRILTADWQRLYDFEVVVREATQADGPALAAIERRAPIAVGDSRVTFDRSADYLAAARLMEDATVAMAEVDGVPAAVEWAALHRTRIGGREYRLVNFIHLRVAAEHQRKGLWGVLVRKLNEKYPPGVEADGDYACAARENASIQTAFAHRPRWTLGPIRALISANGASVPLVGRAATPDDADRIVELLNAAHEREEMFLAYTRQSLCARLERAPELYSWDRMRLTDNAVVGVWPAGPQLRVLRETQGRTTESRPGLVLDYGYAPGAEHELEKLLEYWCAWLGAHDHTHLSIFTSEPSAAFPVIQRLGHVLEPFDLWTSPVTEPDGARLNGVYMDQVYF